MTNGILSIMDGEKVIAKLVVGCDGQYMPEVASQINRSWTLADVDLHSILTLAKAHGVGCDDCRVVIGDLDGKPTVMMAEDFDFGDDDKTRERYFDTLQKPKFNPRWERGTAAYALVVDLGAKK